MSQQRRFVRRSRTAVGLAMLAVAVAYLVIAVGADGGGVVLDRLARIVAAEPAGLAAAAACYALAFLLRAGVWTAVLPSLPVGHAWAAIHVAVLGNHVLPLRLGEPLRITSVLRRTALAAAPVTASGVTLRLLDVVAVLVLAVAAAPGIAAQVVAGSVARDVMLGFAAAGSAGAVAGGAIWLGRLRRRHPEIRTPVPAIAIATVAAVAAWALEAAVVFQIARVAGLDITVVQAVAVTAVAVAAQLVAVSPGGFGSYEAAATAALVALGAEPGPAFAVALATHGVKTVYAMLAGAVALVLPSPGYVGRLRLPRTLPDRPPSSPPAPGAPVVAFCPAHNEEATVADVVRRLPDTVCGRPLIPVVVDDGSTDASAARAAAAGARVVRHDGNRGLGAAVRTGLAAATALRPAAVVYLDADGEYDPEEIERVANPVLTGAADYVVGSRFAGQIHRMRPHRRLGNVLLTRWLRWTARRSDITDGQSGYRAFAPGVAAHAEIIHDYNYAQVLTLDLLGKGYRYAEVPIRYAFRERGESFVRLGRYLCRVVPAVYRELNAAPRTDVEPAGP